MIFVCAATATGRCLHNISVGCSKLFPVADQHWTYSWRQMYSLRRYSWCWSKPCWLLHWQVAYMSIEHMKQVATFSNKCCNWWSREAGGLRCCVDRTLRCCCLAVIADILPHSNVDDEAPISSLVPMQKKGLSLCMWHRHPQVWSVSQILQAWACKASGTHYSHSSHRMAYSDMTSPPKENQHLTNNIDAGSTIQTSLLSHYQHTLRRFPSKTCNLTLVTLVTIHISSTTVAYSPELVVLLSKHRISGGGAYLYSWLLGVLSHTTHRDWKYT